MTKAEISALLGRSLTSIEDTNFETYLDIATEALKDLICSPLDDINEAREFSTREGYSTAFVDIFTDVSEVKINGEVTEDYTVRQWDKRSASWYNSLVFESKFEDGDEIEVTADWGFTSGSGGDSAYSAYPADLQMLLAGLFDSITKKNKYDPTISSKQVEDFRISFNADVDLDEAFTTKYQRTITKYSLCNIPYVIHGKICNTCEQRTCECLSL
jgi:hypothetical protein